MVRDIEELRKKLAKKEEELTNVSSTVEGISLRIKAITAKFETQLRRIHVKQAKLNEDMTGFEREKE